MSRIINVGTNKNIVNFVADYISKSDKKIAIISGGKRPFIFINRKLAQGIGKAFFSPFFYTNDEFVEQSVFEKFRLAKISDIEAIYLIYKIIKDEEPHLLKGRASFASFMEWSQEIFSFIEQLDLENISEAKLKAVRANAEIGYDVPANINNFLKNIFKIRKIFHTKLDESFRTTKGYNFLKATELDYYEFVEKFEEIILLAPFYLYKTEFKIFKKLYAAGNLTIIVQGDPKEFDILKSLYSELGEAIPIIKSLKNSYELNIYSTIDDQSQGSCLKNLISSYSENDLDKTVVIVAEPRMLQSVVSEISIVTNKYNVSAGYPAEKSAVFLLINEIVAVQLSRKGEYYRSKDFIKVLMNPLFKNMKFFGDNTISMTVAHKIEEFLSPDSNKSLSGKMFISLKEISESEDLINDIKKNIFMPCEHIHSEKIIEILNEFFEYFFTSWEKIETFLDLSNVIFNFLNKLHNMSAIESYPLNMEAVNILLSMSTEIKHGEVAKVKFKHEEIFVVFKKLIKNKKISLTGSPLKGLQVLGLLETRNLSFDNVFIVGMTDSAIPAIKKEYYLVPKDIMYTLGIEMTHKDYEIQRYHLSRIIAGSKKLNLIYPDNGKEERSRFIESIMWEKQLELRDLNAVKVSKLILPRLPTKKTLKQKYAKNQEVKKYLKSMPYTHSKIDSYLTCRLKFYFQYVLSLDNEGEIGSEISSGDLGNFIHDFLKDVFHENTNCEELKTEKFEKGFFEKLNAKFDSSSRFQFREDAFLIKEVFKHRMERVLKKERQREFKNIYICEKEYNSSIQVGSGNTYKLNCIIDRIDTNDRGYVIFDYKTGYVPESIISSNFDKLEFKRQSIKKYANSLQLPLYRYIFEKETGLKVLQCGLYNVKKAEMINFPTQQHVYEKCIDILKFLLNEINSGDYFTFDEEDETNCKTCKYFYICR